MKNLVIAVSVIFLTSCAATPPGQMKDSDFVIRTMELKSPPSATLTTFIDGMRYCGPISQGGMHGLPECTPARPDGSLTCDIYAPASTGRSNEVIGRVDISPHSTGSKLSLRVIPLYFGQTERTLNSWENFARGHANKVCLSN